MHLESAIVLTLISVFLEYYIDMLPAFYLEELKTLKSTCANTYKPNQHGLQKCELFCESVTQKGFRVKPL